jgi:hypothetical protein
MPKWTEADIDWLKANRLKGISHCSAHLGRSYHSVSQKLFTLRLPSTHAYLKENVISHRKAVTEITYSNLPVFHEVMLGLHPSALESNRRIWRQRRRIILKMHDEQCFWCGDEANTVDHVTPRHEGGIDKLENLVAACSKCNYAHVNRIKSW